jgi:ribosomal protein S18 acetylase RimI-like enzyme
MNILLRESRRLDIPFLERMLYEAVFWRKNVNTPSFEEGLADSDVRNALAEWGMRGGDVAVIATIDSIPVGAAWYRFWTDSNSTRGYINEIIPVLAIGVHSDYRHQGIGKKMIEWLISYASTHSIQKISLCVSKDNYALNLYRQQDFLEYADTGDSLIMVRKIEVE